MGLLVTVCWLGAATLTILAEGGAVEYWTAGLHGGGADECPSAIEIFEGRNTCCSGCVGEGAGERGEKNINIGRTEGIRRVQSSPPWRSSLDAETLIDEAAVDWWRFWFLGRQLVVAALSGGSFGPKALTVGRCGAD